MSPLGTLRHHVTGAIARGEAVAVVEQTATPFLDSVQRVIRGLNDELTKQCAHERCAVPPVGFHISKIGKKFLHLNSEESGCFLIERATGELFNIKAAGVPDYNKKVKADIGNVYTVNPAELYHKQYNYLR